MGDLRRCRLCDRELHVEAFEGGRRVCRGCRSEQIREWKAQNPERAYAKRDREIAEAEAWEAEQRLLSREALRAQVAWRRAKAEGDVEAEAALLARWMELHELTTGRFLERGTSPLPD
jgi:hypothetical protein